MSHSSRVYLDIETGDIGAEAAGLERLGVRKVDKGCCQRVVEAPGGHRFCVVGRRRRHFEGQANVWQSGVDDA